MNNKGQSLVLFVICLPLILGLFAFTVDTSIIIKENTKLKGIGDSSFSYLKKQKDINKIKKNIMENDNSIKIKIITANKIELQKEVEPLFGRIIGLNKYKIKYKNSINNREKG